MFNRAALDVQSTNRMVLTPLLTYEDCGPRFAPLQAATGVHEALS